MKYIREKLDMKAIILKNKDGSNVVEHIGLYFKGIRASKIDPHWKTFNYMDPDVKYDSRTGSIWQQPENWKQIEEQIQKVLTDLDIKIA